MTALLETRGVWQRFGGLVANSDVSISVGRGRPDLIWTNASCTPAATPSASVMRSAHFVIGRTMSSWSCTSCSSPRSRPMPWRLTCPATSSTGEEHAYAVASPDAAL